MQFKIIYICYFMCVYIYIYKYIYMYDYKCIHYRNVYDLYDFLFF